MKLRIAAIATVFALPVAAATSPAPAGPSRQEAPQVAQKDGAKRAPAQVAKNDCKTPKKSKKPVREASKG